MNKLILVLLCFITLNIFGGVSSSATGILASGTSNNSSSTQYVAWPPKPQTDITLSNSTTVLFVVSNGTGDHNVFSKVTPTGVVPFTSGLLNYDKNLTTFSYKFTTLGNYELIDLFTQSQMKLTISEKQLNSSSESISNNSTDHHGSNSTGSSEQSTTTTTSKTTTSSIDLTETPTGAKSVATSIYTNLSSIIISIILLHIIFLVV